MKSASKNILRTYLRRLTNLTGNNRSILLLRLSAEQMIDVHDLNHLSSGKAFEVIAALMTGKSKKLCQVLDSRVESSNEISRRLKRLQRIDKFIYEERGSNDLHVGWPFIRGKFTDGTLVRAPLLFFPVSLVLNNNDWVLQPREDAGISFNKSFLLAYAFYNKVELPEELLDTTFDDFDADSTVWRTELYQLLKDRIEINFNPDNFRDELIKFEEFKRETFEANHRQGEIKLFPEAVLGIFPQAGSQLVPDYTYLMEAEAADDLEEFFVKRAEPKLQEELQAENIKEEKLYTPFALDAWQENAIRAVKSGKSIVVQGPPGTGKSQLICNLLADSIASGKRALLVCQKRAALDIVFQRLHDIELGDFLGLVHDFRNDRKDILEKVARQIDKIDDYKIRNRSVDIIQMERRFFQLCRRIDQLTEELEEFRQTLYNERECGVSIKELYLNSDPHAEVINVKQEYPNFNFSALNEFLQKLKSYATYAAEFEQDDYVWRTRRSFVSLGVADMKATINVLKDIPAYQDEIGEKVEKIISTKLNLEDCESLLGREDDILGMISVLKDEETYRYFQIMLAEKDDETSMLWLSNMERVFMNCYQNGGPEKTLPPDQLGKLQVALKQRMDARRSLIRLIYWELFSDHKYWIKRVLVANGLEYDKPGLRKLEEKLDSRLNLEHHLTALKTKTWLINIPTNYDAKIFKGWFERKKFAVRAKLIFNSIREVKDAINPQKLTRQEFLSIFHSLLSAVSGIPSKKFDWLNYLSPYQIRHLILNPPKQDHYIQTLKKDFDNLCEFDRIKQNLQPHEATVISKLNDQTGSWEYEGLKSLFVNSLSLAWIDYIETKYPILRMVSSIKMEEMQTELRQLIKEKKKLSKEILLLRARERVYEQVEYNRLNNRITYRDLRHQAVKKKKIWPLRKVIKEYHDELFNLIPCWMASPESVSAIFPMHEVFDLVIFDEASQCFAERGIPAMYRGKQVVIAGDDKQLKPYELYQVRWDDEDEQPDSEVDSLLDLAERYFQRTYLQGHYRSQSPELIDFSNRHFYEGRLKLLPDRNIINKEEPAIEFIKVDGTWENNMNRAEAAAVVNKVLYYLKEFPGLELGVVTFNAPQQMLIMDILEDEAAKSGTPLPVSLFVKNIENVQGDEKDIIIFSVGYAPDAKGKMAMQFGSLNARGGENRLNVAITRAREKVVIISSIWPEQLRTDDSKNRGPKLLRSYLEFAREVQKGEFIPQLHFEVTQSDNWYLKTKLKQWGEQKFPELTFDINALPLADICFRENKRYLGVILTDDESYLSSLSAKDVYAYTQEQLAKKHWDHRMIYSRNFWLDREKVENELIRLVGTQKG